jgi:hypothetical protein
VIYSVKQLMTDEDKERPRHPLRPKAVESVPLDTMELYHGETDEN